MGKIVNKIQLAEIVGVSERSLTEWQKEPGFPIEVDAGRGSSNQYDTQRVIEWMIQRAVGGQKKESTTERLNRVRAEREELALAQEIGLLIPAAETEELLTRVTTAIRSNMMSGNSKLKLELDTLYDTSIDIAVLHDHTREILTHLAELDSELEAGGEEGAVGVSPSTGDVHGGVGEQVSMDSA